MSHVITYESSPLRPFRPVRPKCHRKRWITVESDGKERRCVCSCGHAWRGK